MIVSKLHKLRERARSYRQAEEPSWNYTMPLDEMVVSHMDMIYRDTPLYYMHEDVMEMASGDPARDSIGALVQMGLAKHLPFPELIVEYAVPPNATIFLLVRECHEEVVHLRNMRQFLLRAKKDTPVSIQDLKTSFSAVFVRMTDDGVATSPVHIVDATGTVGAHLTTVPLVSLPDPESPQTKSMEITTFVVKTAIKALLLALSTEGVGQQKIVAPARLNKARIKRGKPAVPDVTVLHLSHYHDRSGRRHSVANGRHVRLHLRAGHIRNQVCGPANKEHKRIFIKPVIVNYRPDQPVPAPVRDVRP